MADGGSPKPRRKIVLRTHRSYTWLTCKERYRIEHIEGYTPIFEALALFLGTVWHKAMEAYLRALRDGHDPRPTGVQALIDGGLHALDLARFRPLFLGYCTRWEAEDRAKWRVVSVEREYQHPLVCPDTDAISRTFVFAGRIDGEVDERQAESWERWNVEHKTAGVDIQDEDYWRARRIDAQNTNYLAKEASPAVGTIYDVVRKPELALRKATPEDKQKVTKTGKLYKNQREEDETYESLEARVAEQIAADPDRFYQRRKIVRLEKELIKGARDRWQIGREIADAALAQRYPRNTTACKPIGGRCPFLGVCLDEQTLTDETLFVRQDPA